MFRIAISALLGAVVYFVWQMMAWMALPIHGPTVKKLPNEGVIREALTAQNLKDGVYVVPGFNDPDEMADPESEFIKNHKSGPLFSIFYQAKGGEPMPPSILGIGFINDLLAAVISAGLLSICIANPICQNYLARVGVIASLGVFLALMAHVSYYNWMRFEWNYTLMFIVDAIVGWVLVGLVQAALIKPSVKRT